MNEEVKKRSRKAFFKRVLRTATTILLIVCTLFCFVVVVSSALERDISIFGYRLFYVVSGSMEPTLPVGSVLIVKEQDTYEVDEIITFYSRDESIKGYPNTHRIISVYEENGKTAYHTKGDANNIEDTAPVYNEDIIGVVRMCLKVGVFKSLIEFINSPMGFFALILLPILIVTLVLMRDFKKNIQQTMRNAAIEEIRAEQQAADNANEKECSEYENQRNDTTE